MFRYVVNITLFCLLVSLDIQAQRFMPHTLVAGVDVPGVFRSLVSRDRNMGEIQVGTNVGSHLVLLEYGFENIDRQKPDFTFVTKGPYFRLGADLTLNPKNPKGHQIFIGFRYGQSNFKNSLTYQMQSQAFNDPVLDTRNDNLKGSWLEWTFGMKIVLTPNLGMGYTMRYKFSTEITGSDILSPFDLPGYGRARKSNNFGLSYYLIYRFQFRKIKKKPELEITS